ncbi:MAG: OmpA family protein [Alteraurantiacibacter sp.]
MRSTLKSPALLLAAAATVALAAPTLAQQIGNQEGTTVTVTADLPNDLTVLTEGPELEGYISRRTGNRVEITSENGTVTEFLLSEDTQIRSAGGFLGAQRTALNSDQLFNGVPVTVETLNWENGLVAKSVRMKNRDLRTAALVHNGTAQRFGEHDTAIAANTAATDALRARVGSIDQYNIRGTTDVNFDSGRWQLTSADQAELCQTAQQAEQMENSLLLVVGYTDNVGDEDFNQELSEKRAGRVVNYLQQHCGWEPWRMLTPTGMAFADPAADNSTPEGRAANRRVAVNILVSKAVDGIQEEAVAQSGF